jgi:UDP-N-acetylglucosamine--N-acetylmuramyl-(pentapeptide) pyrophosphoryl-undecaprenol N-acetylglucosamine transferase
MRVILAGGGTGGHIYPALALARHLVAAEKAEVLFIGTRRGMETDLIPAAGFRLETIPVEGFTRRLSLELGRAVLRAGSGVMAARRLIKQFKPDVVVGTGGYVAGPVVLAAALAGVPTVIHEQNAIPGLTNVWLGRFSRKVCLSFSGSETHFPRPDRTVLTGNPRASEAASATGKQISDIVLNPRMPILLCVGGSHGAARLNQAFSNALVTVLAGTDAQVVYVTGKRYFEELYGKLAPLEVRFPNRLQILPYYHALPELMKRADLMVSRAGATTLAEITALGVPSVLIPSPNVTNNHQEHNARSLVEHGAALLLREAELTDQRLATELVGLLSNKKRLRTMAEASLSLGIPDAAERMAKVIRGVITS